MSRVVVSGGQRLIVQQGRLGIGTDTPLPAVWYDFSDISTLWQDDTRTTPVTTNGDPIGAVDDKTGNGQHLTQTGSVARPTYLTGAQNGLSVADMDASGNAQYIDRATAQWTTIPRPWSMFTVARTPDTVNSTFSRALIAASDTGSSGGRAFNLWLGPIATNGGTWLYRSGSTISSVTYANFAAVGADTWYISEVHAPVGGDYVIYHQNVNDPIASLAAEDIGRGFRIGHDRNTGGKGQGTWEGLVGEVRVYGFDADTLGIRLSIYNELKAKWGL